MEKGPHAPSLEPSHPGEEGKLINISLGYEVLPLCLGPGKLCINVSRQTWAFILPPKEDLRTLLGIFTVLSLSVNHVYTTETLGKELGIEQKTLCKGFTYKNFKYTPVLGMNVMPNQKNYLWLATPLLIGHPMVCDCLSAQITLTLYVIMPHKLLEKLLTLRWSITMTKDSLAGLAVEWHPSSQIVLNKQIGPEQWDI